MSGPHLCKTTQYKLQRSYAKNARLWSPCHTNLLIIGINDLFQFSPKGFLVFKREAFRFLTL